MRLEYVYMSFVLVFSVNCDMVCVVGVYRGGGGGGGKEYVCRVNCDKGLKLFVSIVKFRFWKL